MSLHPAWPAVPLPASTAGCAHLLNDHVLWRWDHGLLVAELRNNSDENIILAIACNKSDLSAQRAVALKRAQVQSRQH